MKNSIGIWIDHRRAVIVGSAGAGDDPVEIQSHADKQGSRSDGIHSSQPHASQGTQADDVVDRKFAHQLNAYYDRIAALVCQAPSLFLFGPGEAKGEFKKRLESERPGPRTVHVETADKLSDPQIAAKVRLHFAQEARGVVFT